MSTSVKVFNDEATLAMGAAFDRACASVRGFARDNEVCEVIAKRIIEAAAKGERDPVQLHSQALIGFYVDEPGAAALRPRSSHTTGRNVANSNGSRTIVGAP
jgi:hypothetical protein